jgi:hypothetical protein
LRRKTVHQPEPVIAANLLEMARKSVQADVLKRTTKCVVCGSETASTSSEQLCWVCRRLKISAWRDSDQQMTAQE